MRRKMVVLVIICAFMVLSFSKGAFAQTVDGPSGLASAEVPSFLEFSMADVVRMTSGGGTDPWKDGEVLTTPSFDFGTLSEQKDPDTKKFLYMKGQYYYYVLLIATTSGRPYTISETGTGFTGVENAVFMVPDYQQLDELVSGKGQGAMTTSCSLGTASSVVGTHNVYTSTDGLARIIRGVIAISGPLAGEKLPFSNKNGHNGATEVGLRQYFGDPNNTAVVPRWTPITKDTKAGSYSGSIKFTLTLNS